MNLKDLAKGKNLLSPGHRTCAGCAVPIITRAILRVVGDNSVVSCATGCLEVTTTIYPNTSWKVPYIHSAFENAPATASGIVAAISYLKKKSDGKRFPKVLVFGGDGATYDIGLQSLSGALERGEDFLYICYDNEAYMNTGNQRSSATPPYAATATTPLGRLSQGKLGFRKPIAEIVAAHSVPYVAQASVSHLLDVSEKIRKALSISGPKFINVLSPCNLGWEYPPEKTIEIARLAVETRFWPLFEVEQGTWRVTYDVPKPRDIEDFLKPQGRFAHLFEEKNRQLVEEIRRHVNERWEAIKNK